VSTVPASRSNQPTYLCSICRCIFSHSGYILVEPAPCSLEAEPMFPRGEKNPRGIAGNGVSMTCCILRHGVRKVDPPRFLRSFLIFYFPKVAAGVLKRISGSSFGSIQFMCEVGGLGKICFVWGLTKMPSFVLASLILPYIVESFAYFSLRLHKYFVSHKIW
jgi:hypothetical protein